MTPGRITSRHPVPSAGWGIHNNKAILLMECAGSVQAKISMNIEWKKIWYKLLKSLAPLPGYVSNYVPCSGASL